MACSAYTLKLKHQKILLTRSETLADKLAIYSRRIITTISKNSIPSSQSDRIQQQNRRNLLDLDSGDFAFVCIYDLFLTMLRSAMDSHHPTLFDDQSKTNARVRVVDFKSFRHRYWNLFPLDLRKSLSVDLVFSEIMGTIKGSIYICQTLQSLDTKKYQDLSVRVPSNFSSSKDRSRVFRIF